MAATEIQPILESGEKPGRHTPPDVRTGFVIKVYSIVCMMLVITFGITYPFVFYETETKAWVKANPLVIGLAFVFLLMVHILHFCMMMEMCCGGSSIARGYIKMLVTVPFNYMYLAAYCVSMGFVVGLICTGFKATSVCFVFALTAAIIVGLTIYAYYTECDFTGMGAYILIALIALAGLGFIGIFFPAGSFFHKVVAAAGACIFGFIIISDTQQIFGEASHTGEKKYQFTIDMYAFAALELYMDFINFFIYMLQLLGERD